MIYLEPEMQFLRKTRHGWWFADPSHVTAHIRKLSRLFIKPCSSERFKFPLRREKEPRNGWWPLATFRHRGSARRRRWGRYKKHHLLYKCISECVVVMSIWICSNRLRIYISFYNHLHKSDIVLQCEALNVFLVFSKTFALNARAFRFNFCLASVLLVPNF